VHGGGPEITRTLEKLGGKAEFIDGQRVTNASDLKVVEMVLTGSINTELVTLLNGNGIAQAVGVSGKDGGLIGRGSWCRRARPRTGGRGHPGQPRLPGDASPAGLRAGGVAGGPGEDGQSYNINADNVAAELAVAIGAQKLIYLSTPRDPQGWRADRPADQRRPESLDRRRHHRRGMKAKANSILRCSPPGCPASPARRTRSAFDHRRAVHRQRRRSWIRA